MSNYDGGYGHGQGPHQPYPGMQAFSPPPPRSGLPGPVIALLAGAAVLVLVLVGGGIFFAVNRLSNAEPTPTPKNCWDGTTVTGTGSCPQLTGDEALQYVYAVDALTCDVIGASLKPSLAAGMDCTLKDHKDTKVYLSQWKNQEVAQKELSFRYPAPAPAATANGIATYQDDTTGEGDLARITQLYQDFPFSVAVEAATVEERDAALNLVQPKDPQALAESGTAASVTTGAVECWNGSGADTSSACPRIAGRQALEWVFKDDQLTSCDLMEATSATATMLACRMTDRPDVTVFLTEWDTLAGGEAFMADYGVTPTDVAPGRTWSSETKSGRYVSEWMYNGYPYSQAVMGPDAETTKAALAELSARGTAELDYRGVVPGR